MDRASWGSPLWIAFSDRMSRLLRQAIAPVPRPSNAVLLILMSATVSIAVGTVVWRWLTGTGPVFSVAGYLQVSDAWGYQQCATSLASAGKFGNVEWCSRRVLYPAMLSPILASSGWYAQVALLVQAILTGLALLAVAIEAASLLGLVSGIFVYVILFSFAQQFVLSLYVTEVAGFAMGLSGMALLLRYCEFRRQAWLLAGLALISIGLMARAGALLVLPALVLWGVLMTRKPTGSIDLRSSLWVLLAILTGFALQLLVLAGLGIDPGNTGGNFSTSLYGLATGSRDWKQAYRDYGPLFQAGETKAFHEIYWIAFAKIRESPTIFVNALVGAGHEFATTLFKFGSLLPYNTFLNILLLAGLVESARRWRSPLGSLLLLTAAAEFVSAPLIVDSAGHRVFAVTVSVRVLLAALGLRFIISTFFVRRQESPSSSEPRGTPILPLALGSIMMISMVVPVTPVARLFRLQPLDGTGCPPGLTEIVVRIDRETQTLAVAEGKPNRGFLPFQVSINALQSDPVLTASFYGKDFQVLSPGTVVIRGVQRLRENFGTMIPLISAIPLPSQPSDIVSICASRSQGTSLAKRLHYQVESVRLLTPRRDR